MNNHFQLVTVVRYIKVPIIVTCLRTIVRPPRNVTKITLREVCTSPGLGVYRRDLTIIILRSPGEWLEVLLEW